MTELQKYLQRFKEKDASEDGSEGSAVLCSEQLINKVMGSLTAQSGFSRGPQKSPSRGGAQHSSAAIHSLKQRRVLQLIWTDQLCQTT